MGSYSFSPQKMKKNVSLCAFDYGHSRPNQLSRNRVEDVKEKDTHLFPRMSFNSAPPSQVLELKMYTTFGSPVGFVGICTALFVMTSLCEDETFELVITPGSFWCRRVVVKEEDEFFLEDKEEDFCWCCTNTCCEADKDEDIIVIQVFAKERVFTCACVCESARAFV